VLANGAQPAGSTECTVSVTVLSPKGAKVGYGRYGAGLNLAGTAVHKASQSANVVLTAT